MSKGDKTASADFLNNLSSFKNKYLQWIEQNTHYFLIIVFTVLGFAYRLFLSIGIYGILHPDEIYQALEMGHKIAYGSAIIPPEFQKENLLEPSYAASRSWSFPLFFAIIMKTLSFMNLDYFRVILPVIRFILVVNATFLIYSSRKLAWQITKNKNVELFTTVFVAIWFRLAEFTIRSFNNTFFLPIFIFAIYRILLSLETKEISYSNHVLVIVGIGLSTYNRLDLFLIVFGFFFMTFSFRNLSMYYQYAIDGLMGWGLGLSIDYYYYGGLKLPPLNWIKFNLIENRADVFSVSNWDYYIYQVIVLDGLLSFVIFNFFLMMIITTLIVNDRKTVYKENKLIFDSYFKQFVNVSMIWLVYTSFWRELTVGKLIKFITTGEGWEPISHKEVRFIMGGLLLLLIFLATGFQISIILLTKFINWFVFDVKRIKRKKNILTEIKYWTNLIVPAIIILLIVNQSFSYANERQYIEQFADINHALTFVGHQDDVSGVVIGVNWYQAGSYTYSHLNSDVPIVFVNFFGVDESTYVVNTKFINSYAQDQTYNYFIAPDYQFTVYPGLSAVLLQNNWILIKIFEGKVDLWTRA
ncbi:MAG: hypothetical protein GPJ54_18745 [Candidatus Heimdallarchaeota archaeon]|nr:hypothetical protein [Candidatus Heimdallarchaeota archaeon]